MTSSKKTAKTSLVVSLFAFVGIFIPSIIGMDGFNGGFAISAFCVLVFLTALVTAIVFWAMARREKAIEKGDSLAHWTYTDDEWSKFVALEKDADASYKKTLLKIIVAFCAVIGIGFFIADPEGGAFVLAVMAGLAVLMTGVAFLSIRASRKRLKMKSEAYIAKDGLIFGEQFCSWNIVGAQLEGVTYIESTDPAILDFEYSIFMPRQGRQHHNVRVPVPQAELGSVDALVAKIGASLKRA